MKLKSIFSDGGKIPSKYTCEGADVNPPLEFIEIPENAKSLVLIIDDPDSPLKTWGHWILWNISPGVKSIRENSIPSGAIEGDNDFGNIGYGGPCPNSGEHRYQFKLYALDTKLNLPRGSAKNEVEKSIKGHIIDKTVLTGLYQK